MVKLEEACGNWQKGGDYMDGFAFRIWLALQRGLDLGCDSIYSGVVKHLGGAGHSEQHLI